VERFENRRNAMKFRALVVARAAELSMDDSVERMEDYGKESCNSQGENE
jgi:hypothetical protein